MGQLISKTDIEELIAEEGINDLTDDGVEDTIVDQMIEYAENHIFSYLSFKYSVSVLVQSPEIRRMAVYLSAHYISQRRGNPSYYDEVAEQIEDMLLEIRDGDKELVDNLGNVLGADNYTHSPMSMINQMVDEREGLDRIRTVTETSFQTSNTNPFYGSIFGRGFFGT